MGHAWAHCTAIRCKLPTFRCTPRRPSPAPQAFGKRKLRWKRIAEHFDHKAKSCKKHYTKLTGKEVPEEADE